MGAQIEHRKQTDNGKCLIGDKPRATTILKQKVQTALGRALQSYG
jgi:hypothetical protein